MWESEGVGGEGTWCGPLGLLTVRSDLLRIPDNTSKVVSLFRGEAVETDGGQIVLRNLFTPGAGQRSELVAVWPLVRVS